jgi:hypothetical protein
MRTVFDDANRIGTRFLITDLGLAFTFLKVAHTSHSEETQRRNHKNARRAYDAVLTLLPKLKMNEAERKTIDEKLALLKTNLEALGEEF